MSTSDPSLSFFELMKAEWDKFQHVKTEMEKVVRERDILKKKVEDLNLKKTMYKTRAREWKAMATTLSISAGIPPPPSPSPLPTALSKKRKRKEDVSVSGTKEAADSTCINSGRERCEQQANVQAKIPIFGSTYLIPTIINKIKNNLSKDNLEAFQQSCFGHLLRIGGELRFQGQLLIQLLLHMDTASSSKDCLVFKINNTRAEFGAREFSIITGLRLGTMEEAATTTSSSYIQENVFMKSLILMKDIENKFVYFCRNGKDGDEMPVKLALLCFLFGIVLAGTNTKQVDQLYLPLIEDLDKFNAFPWGRVAFELLASSMLSARSRIDNSDGLCTVPSLSICGFSVALQIWAYELMPSVAAYCAVRTNIGESQIPRILRWSIQKKMILSKDIKKCFIPGDGAQLVLDGIQASTWELEALTTAFGPPKPKNRTSTIVKDEMPDAAVPTSSVNAPTHLRACSSTQTNAHHVVKAEMQRQPGVGRCPTSSAADVVILSDSDDDDDVAPAATAASTSHSKDSDDKLLIDAHMTKFYAKLKHESGNI